MNSSSIQSLKDLNNTFAIKNIMEFSAGENNFTKALITHKSGTLEVYLYGAHITSWIKPEFSEILFMSKKADFTKGKGLRGGVPVIFPQFGGGELPNHGFVRNQDWEVSSSEVLKNGDVKLVLEIKDNESSKKVWPHSFKLTLEIILSEELTTNLIVQNTGKSDFSFTSALHTYFKVSDIGEVSVSGLKGVTYLDKVNDMKETLENNEPVKFTTFFDRVYKSTPPRLEIHDTKLKRSIYIEKENFKDSILWNPWETAKDLKDMHENGYKEFICVESGNASSKVEVKSGDTHFSSQRIGINASK